MNPDLVSLLQRGVQAHNAGRLDDAEAAYRQVLKKLPEQPDALRFLGLIAQRRGDVVAAEDWLRRSLRARPNQSQVWLALGDVLDDASRWADAEAAYRRAVELQPDLAHAHYHRARVLRQLGRPADAHAAVEQALRLKPGTADMLQLRAMIEEESGAFDAALTSLDAALAAAPDRPALHHNRAVVLQRSQRHGESLAAHERAQALGLNVADAHYNHGNTLQSLGRAADALAAYRRALALDPQHGLSLYDVARLRWVLGDADFCAELDAAERAAPQSPLASGIKARLLLKAERHADAAAAFQRAAERAPDAAGYHDGLGQSLSRLGHHDAALAAHERAAALAPSDAVVRSNHAHSLLAAGQPAAAAAQAEAAHALAPDDQLALALLGLAWRQLGDPREAWLHDYGRFIRVFDLPAPAGWADMAAFNAALAEELADLHTDAQAPIDQTLREGTQTRGNLLDQRRPLVDALKAQLKQAIEQYIAELPQDPAHPFLARRGKTWHFTDSWSSRLRSRGFHTHHVHTHGWISSCYYVAVPPAVERAQAGWITFGQPDLDLGLAPRRVEQPRAGRLVLFPSCFWHGTLPFEDDAPRLTIAFDVKPGP